MTFEELKAEAEKQGYNLIKKQPYIKLLPCTCGYKKIETFRYYYGNWFCECPKCGNRSDVCSSERKAKINWNKKVQND